MCGRYALATTPGELAANFQFALSPDEPAAVIGPRWNIAPTQLALIVAPPESGGPPQLRAARWGLVPEWAARQSSSPRSGPLHINARAETASTKPVFRGAARHGRCLVPADGFYEWTGPRHRRRPVFFSLPGGGPLLFAGLFQPTWSDHAEHDRLCERTWERTHAPGTFAIVTIAARGVAAAVHDRMPTILSGEAAMAWLAGEPSQVSDIARLAEDLLEPRSASSLVNHVGNEGPHLLNAPKETDGRDRTKDAVDIDDARDDRTLFG